MAIVRIDFTKGQPEGFTSSVSEVVHAAMEEILGIPPRENFIIFQSHEPGKIFHAPDSCSPVRLKKLIFVQISLNEGRSSDLKSRFFDQLSQRLASAGLVDASNVFVNLVEVVRDSWFWGSSKADG